MSNWDSHGLFFVLDSRQAVGSSHVVNSGANS